MKANFTPFPILETKRTILRELRETDDPYVLDIKKEEAVSKYTGYPTTMTLDDVKQRRERINKGIKNNEWIEWVIEAKDTKKIIGGITIWNLNHELNSGEFGFHLATIYQHQGYMSEILQRCIQYGFDEMDLDLLEAYTRYDNLPCILLLERNGFIYRETIQEENFYSNELDTLVVYELIRGNHER